MTRAEGDAADHLIGRSAFARLPLIGIGTGLAACCFPNGDKRSLN
jgi:hypothetical protein